jgi:hypothetical protein
MTDDEKLDVIIFIVSAGPNVPTIGKDVFQETIDSIDENIGDDIKYTYFISTDNRKQYDFIKEKFEINPELLLEARLTTNSWAREFNYFFDKYKHITKNIIYSHDDIVIKTKDFYKIITDSLRDKQEEVGWVTFTNERYYNHDGKILPNSIKDRYAIDRSNYPYIFECHKFKDLEKTYKPELLTYPERPVKVHTPFPHFCFVSVESLEKIGHCCEWTEYTILIDDDWAHEALNKNLNNVWIPNIFYDHPNPYHSPKRLRHADLRYQTEAHHAFEKKWGFSIRNKLTDEQIKQIREKCKGTKIADSSYRNTFDWDYLT